MTIKKSATFAILIVLGLSFVNGVTAQPTVNIISIEPEEPTIDSDFTVTANFSWTNITSVNLTVQPCSKDICFVDVWSTEMTETNGKYIGTVQLDKEGAIYVQYKFEVIAEGNSYSLDYQDSWKTYLKLDNGDGNNGDGTSENKDNGTPGFELLFLLTALSIVTYVIKRKR